MLQSSASHRVASAGSRRARPRVIAPIAAAALVAGLTACSPSAAPAGDGDTIRIGLALETISFAPTGQDRLSLGMVYDYLFYQEAGVYSPRAAASFEYSEGNTVLDITLRDDLVFSDGTVIDADVVKAMILWSKDNGAFFTSIQEVEVVDETTLRIHQSNADRNVMLSLWAMPLVPVSVTENPESAATDPIESGPYLLDSDGTTDGAIYAFERNPDYWGADDFPYDSVTATLLPDDTSRLNALKSGQIDVAPVAATTAAEAEGSGFRVNELKGNFGGMLLGDRRGEINPAIGDVRVRQAINMAFDREAIIQAVYAGYASASAQPFAEGMPGYQDDQEDVYAYDPEGAKALLAEAGYPDGFELTIPTYPSATSDIEPFLKQAMADIGITLVFESQSDDTWLPAFSGGDYAVVPVGLPFVQSVDLAQPDFFWNPWNNDDPAAVGLLDQINSGTPEEAQSATDELGALQLDEAWYAIWAHPSTVWASIESIEVGQPQYADYVLFSDILPAG